MMIAPSEDLSREDRFVRSNHRLMLGGVAAFGLWQLADMGSQGTTGAAHAPLLGFSLAAAAVWTTILLILLQRRRQVRKDPALRAAMEDERAENVRLRAYRVAFGAAIGSAALLGVPGAAHMLAAVTATKLVVLVGVTVFIVASVVLDRE